MSLLPIKKVIIVMIITVMSSLLSYGTDYYVKLNTSGGGDGSSWAQAWNRQQFTFYLYNTAVDGDVFHLAAGVYNPWFDNNGQAYVSNTTKRFLIKKSISIIGGYDANPTVGDIPSNDYSKVVLSGDFTNSGSTGYVTNVLVIAEGVVGVELRNITISDSKSASHGGGAYIYANAKARFTNVRFTNNKVSSRGGAMYMASNSEITIENSLIDNNQSSDRGGAIALYGGSVLTMEDVEFRSNYSSAWGGAVHNELSTAYVRNTLFDSNNGSEGGAFHNTKAVLSVIKRSTFSNNISRGQGGAIDSWNGSTMLLDTVSFLNNKASSWGGAVHNDNKSICTISNCLFEGNQGVHGGAFHNTDSKAKISYTKILNNVSTAEGGGLESYSYSTLEMDSVVVRGNRATTWGGGMHNNAYSTCTINNCIFENNRGDHGGGFHNTASTAVITNTQINNNEAYSGQGGGIDNYSSSKLTLTNVEVNNNTATTWGGGIHNDGSCTATLTDCEVSGNKAVHGGGFHNTSGKAYIYSTVFNGNEGADGGGITNYNTYMLLENCDISNNIATRIGGAGIQNEVGTLDVHSCLIRDNRTTGASGRGAGISVEAGKVLITNSTVTGNVNSLYHGGGIYIAASTTIISSTITNNEILGTSRNGGGIARAGGTTILRNSIVSGNFKNGVANDIYGTYSSSSKYNIVGANFYLSGLSSSDNSMPFDVSTHLGTLQDNGGPTMTHALTGNKSSNKAMAGGDPSVVSDADAHLYYDQRGVLRTIPVSIGAYQYFDPLAALKANNDTILTFTNTVIDINQLGNDAIPVDCGTLNITFTKHNANATVVLESNNRFTYTPPLDFEGRDSITYTLSCSSDPSITSTAKIYITVLVKPDNISDADCVIPAPKVNWGIKEASSLGNMFTYMPAFVGDLDGNGIPEIVTGKDRGGTSSHGGTQISIFKDGGTGQRIDFATVANYQGYMPGNMAIAKVKMSDSELKNIIVVVENDNYLRAYTLNSDNTVSNLWQSSSSIPGQTGKWVDVSDSDARKIHYGTSVNFADFNGDGYAEIYCGSKIFDAATGQLLCVGSSNRGFSPNAVTIDDLTMTFAADILGDSKLELLAGNQVYQVNIVSRIDPTLNSMTVIRQVTPPSSYPADGLTQAIDIDNDGKLEVVVQRRSGNTNNSTHMIYIWSPDKEQVLASIILSEANVVGVPFIGDIDGDGKPEIVVISSNYPLSGTTHCFMHALKYDGTSTLKYFWKMNHTDNSGQTGVTLFDFDQDGKAELVYRDQTLLRIINGSGVDDNNQSIIVGGMLDMNTATKYSIASVAGTGYEYPVVADIDEDGQAEILIGGGQTGDISTNSLRIFKSSDPVNNPWAPARKVWNQYAYNAVNVNEDLTIPKIQLNPATVFPGADGQLGTDEDVRPFNNFLQQQTKLNKNGTPLWLAPNAEIGTPKPAYNYYADGDSIVVKLVITNTGDASLQSPVYVTVYKDSVSVNTTVKHTYAYNNSIAPGASAEIVFTMNNIKEWLGDADENTLLYLKINDNGNAADVQSVCESNNAIDLRPFAYILRAVDDYVRLINGPDNIIDVIANDVYLCMPDDLNLTIVQSPVNGSALVENNKIKYTPSNGFTGTDSIKYSIECNNEISIAKVTIVVYEVPDNIGDAECFIEPEEFEWDIKRSWISNEQDVSTYVTPVVGDVNDDGIPEILITKHTGYSTFSGIYVYWGHDRNNPTLIPTKVGGNVLISSIALAKVEINNVVTPIVVMVERSTGLVYAYNVSTGVEVWHSTEKAVKEYNTSTPDYYCLSPAFADFDNDGIPELYFGNRIFDASNGKLLVDGPSGANQGKRLYAAVYYKYFSVAADVIGDSKLELITGTEVYNVNIVDKNNPSLNSLTLAASIPDVNVVSGLTIKDGNTVIADINQDGRLDVVVSNSSATHCGLIAWDVETESLIAKGAFTASSDRSAIPFIGNIDDDLGLEIVLATPNYVTGLKWDGNQTFYKAYEMTTSDDSGATGITLFDFNQDGKGELVYRDQTLLRILHAVPPTLPNTVGTFDLVNSNASISATSGTFSEYPIVADVDNDGAAEIVVTGGNTAGASSGTLRIYKSGTDDSWAPARKVWNQYAYNVVNINEDLTIPRVQLNPAMIFPGEDGVLGTSYDIQPYNAFLQQQTRLNKNGNRYWEAADYVFDGAPITNYYADGDSLVISFSVKNIGDVSGSAPFYVAVYKDSRLAGNAITVKAYPNVPEAKGATVNYTIKIPNFYAGSINTLHVVLNDKGEMSYINPECNNENNIEILGVDGVVRARNDYATVFECGETNIPVLDNDDYVGTSLAVVGNPKYGTVSIVGNQLKYQNDGGSSLSCEQTAGKIDTITYQIPSASSSSNANVFITILKTPAMVLEGACSINPHIVLTHTYTGMVCTWEYSVNGTDNWQQILSGENEIKLKIDKEGFYRLTINYNNSDYQIKKGLEITGIKKVKLPGEVVWYDVSGSFVDITW